MGTESRKFIPFSKFLKEKFVLGDFIRWTPLKKYGLRAKSQQFGCSVLCRSTGVPPVRTEHTEHDTLTEGHILVALPCLCSCASSCTVPECTSSNRAGAEAVRRARGRFGALTPVKPVCELVRKVSPGPEL